MFLSEDKEICWIHNQHFKSGDQCPDCSALEAEYRTSLYGENEEEPVDTLKFDIIKIFSFVLIVFLAIIIVYLLIFNPF